MKHHPSTTASPVTSTASPRTAADLSREFHKLIRVFDANDLFVKSILQARLRLAAILEFSHQHDAPSSPNDWDDDLRMVFSIQYPELIPR